MTMTGDVYRDSPIVDCQPQLATLWQQLAGPAQVRGPVADQPQNADDTTVIERARNAANGEKFGRLFAGDWAGYPSQSEADLALVSIVAFFSQNRTQIARIFRMSGLGQRPKAQRNDYVGSMIDHALQSQLPLVDIGKLREALDEVVHSRPASRTEDRPDKPHRSQVAFPPGLVGDIAAFILEAAPRPVAEIALVGAIGLMAGLTGRAFNVSATGLNMYVLCLAPTGTGKEAINSGIMKLVTAARGDGASGAPGILDFVGPSDIRSDAALIKWLARSPCIFGIQGEWGLRLKQMSTAHANSHEIGVKRVLLDLFNKSGHGNILSPLAYSDREKNTPAISSPAFTLIGESTPERFYEALDEAMISDGLLPRFLTIEYNGLRQPESTTHSNASPSFALLDMLRTLTAHCVHIMSSNGVQNVGLEESAASLMNEFNAYCDEQINNVGSRDAVRHMWNRAHLKALKLAGLVAVGCGPYDPTINRETAMWATDLVARDVRNIVERFEQGEIGSGVLAANEGRQVSEIVRVISYWLRSPPTECGKYGMPAEMHEKGVILGSALTKKLFQTAAFRNDRLGASAAIKRALQHLLDGDEIREVQQAQMSATFGTTARAYVISRTSTFSV
jgi:hypothetical protein